MYSRINFSILYKCQLGVYNSLVFSTTLSIKKCLLAVLNSFITLYVSNSYKLINY